MFERKFDAFVVARTLAILVLVMLIIAIPLHAAPHGASTTASTTTDAATTAGGYKYNTFSFDVTNAAASNAVATNPVAPAAAGTTTGTTKESTNNKGSTTTVTPANGKVTAKVVAKPVSKLLTAAQLQSLTVSNVQVVGNKKDDLTAWFGSAIKLKLLITPPKDKLVYGYGYLDAILYRTDDTGNDYFHINGQFKTSQFEIKGKPIYVIVELPVEFASKLLQTPLPGVRKPGDSPDTSADFFLRVDLSQQASGVGLQDRSGTKKTFNLGGKKITVQQNIKPEDCFNLDATSRDVVFNVNGVSQKFTLSTANDASVLDIDIGPKGYACVQKGGELNDQLNRFDLTGITSPNKVVCSIRGTPYFEISYGDGTCFKFTPLQKLETKTIDSATVKNLEISNVKINNKLVMSDSWVYLSKDFWYVTIQKDLDPKNYDAPFKLSFDIKNNNPMAVKGNLFMHISFLPSGSGYKKDSIIDLGYIESGKSKSFNLPSITLSSHLAAGKKIEAVSTFSVFIEYRTKEIPTK